MPKHQRRIIQKIPDFDILSEDPRELCEEVVRELTAHNYKDVKYTKHAGVGEVISEHYDIRVGDEVIAFLYKPLACHSYNTIRIHSGGDGRGRGESIRIATIDTMLSFYLAFIYADRVYYDISITASNRPDYYDVSVLIVTENNLHWSRCDLRKRRNTRS
jgi:hypothetical protein